MSRHCSHAQLPPLPRHCLVSTMVKVWHLGGIMLQDYQIYSPLFESHRVWSLNQQAYVWFKPSSPHCLPPFSRSLCRRLHSRCCNNKSTFVFFPFSFTLVLPWPRLLCPLSSLLLPLCALQQQCVWHQHAGSEAIGCSERSVPDDSGSFISNSVACRGLWLHVAR